jgi:hypothetical protein
MTNDEARRNDEVRMTKRRHLSPWDGMDAKLEGRAPRARRRRRAPPSITMRHKKTGGEMEFSSRVNVWVLVPKSFGTVKRTNALVLLFLR